MSGSPKDAEPQTNTKAVALDGKPFADIVSGTLTTASTATDALSLAPGQSDVDQALLDNIWLSLEKEDKRPNKAISPLASVAESLAKDRLMGLLDLAIQVLDREETLVEVAAPVVIVGDIHGQYSDLLDIFDKLGWPPSQRYLFTGDYVDRGSQSIEVICLLLNLKIRHPTDVYLLRGNHESGEVNAMFGFKQECMKRFDLALWDAFQECFKYLPLVGLVADALLCMHGGISPHLAQLDDVRRLVKPLDVPDSGLVCDLLWADPAPPVRAKLREHRGYVYNEVRKTSYWFGDLAVDHLLRSNGLQAIVRGHELAMDGYSYHFDRKVLTIFSAPHYCGFSNDAGTLLVNADLTCQVTTFTFKRYQSPSTDMVTRVDKSAVDTTSDNTVRELAPGLLAPTSPPAPDLVESLQRDVKAGAKEADQKGPTENTATSAGTEKLAAVSKSSDVTAGQPSETTCTAQKSGGPAQDVKLVCQDADQSKVTNVEPVKKT